MEMENKINKQVPTNTITRDLSEIAKETGNVYEATVIIAKRANQIASEVKQELSSKLEEFSSYADTLEETFENKEQIEIQILREASKANFDCNRRVSQPRDLLQKD